MKKDDWVLIKDRIPKENERVLLFNGFRIFDLSWMQWTNHDEEWLRKEFTHWMPLPPLPDKV
jgi:hypothetical protein